MNKVEIQIIHPETDGIIEYHLSSGNKHLLLSLNRVSAFAETEITTTDNEKIKGTTTELYRKAKELLQREAKHGGPIKYRMSTGFTSMKSWIQTTGKSIFHWERSYLTVDDPQKLVAETTIFPN